MLINIYKKKDNFTENQERKLLKQMPLKKMNLKVKSLLKRCKI